MNQQRLMQVLLAPQISEKATHVADKHEQVIFRVAPDATVITSYSIHYTKLYERLAAEMLEASENRGGAVKKRDEVHRMADANKAFAHFRF